MLLNKHNLAVAAFASKESSRYSLQAILVSKDGTVATDGTHLVHVTLSNAKGENFPPIPGLTPANGDTKLLLPVEAANKLLKAVPNEKSLTILNHAVVGVSDEERLKFAVTDLDNTQVFTPKKETGQFPNWEAVIPKDDLTPPVATITLDASRLAALAKAAASFSDDGYHRVTVKFYGGDKAATLTANNEETGQKWEAVLTPVRPR